MYSSACVAADQPVMINSPTCSVLLPPPYDAVLE
jgi:hypothetical protein